MRRDSKYLGLLVGLIIRSDRFVDWREGKNVLLEHFGGGR